MQGWTVVRGARLLAIVLVAACQGQAPPEQVAEGLGAPVRVIDAAAGTATPAAYLREAPPFALVADDRPVTWSTCTPIRWTLAPGRVDLVAQEAIRAGVQQILDLAGLESRFEDVTDGVRSGSGDEIYDIVVQVVAHEATDLLSGEEWGRTEASRRGRHWASATITLSQDGVGVLDAPGAPFDWETLAMHETGHAVGLSHTTDTGSLMYPTLELAAAAPSGEDLAALDRLRAAAATCGR